MKPLLKHMTAEEIEDKILDMEEYDREWIRRRSSIQETFETWFEYDTKVNRDTLSDIIDWVTTELVFNEMLRDIEYAENAMLEARFDDDYDDGYYEHYLGGC